LQNTTFRKGHFVAVWGKFSKPLYYNYQIKDKLPEIFRGSRFLVAIRNRQTRRRNEKSAAKSDIPNITGLFLKLMKSTERSSIKFQLKKYAVAD